MRFTKPFWSGIADGSITTAYRWWKRPTVVAGRIYRTGGGRVRVTSVDRAKPEAVTARAAKAAGYSSLDDLQAYLGSKPVDRDLYMVRFEVVDEPDPRQELAANDSLNDDDVADIRRRLDRYDNASSHGAWTHPTLELIAQHPGRRAPDLAEMAGRETKPFKLDVRKLKNLGLTHSLRIGYELSPRGAAYLNRTGSTEIR